MKRDIWAAITFLTTLVLFYLAQVEGTPQKVLSSADESGAVETVVVGESATETAEGLLFRDPGTLDS